MKSASGSLWGYLVWGAVGLVIAIPEISAASGRVPWPTISGMVGHLEYRWSWVALIVVAAIVFVIYHSVRYPWAQRGQLTPPTSTGGSGV